MARSEALVFSFCPDHGENVRIDEDGCCVTCGTSATHDDYGEPRPEITAGEDDYELAQRLLLELGAHFFPALSFVRRLAELAAAETVCDPAALRAWALEARALLERMNSSGTTFAPAEVVTPDEAVTMRFEGVGPGGSAER